MCLDREQLAAVLAEKDAEEQAPNGTGEQDAALREDLEEAQRELEIRTSEFEKSEDTLRRVEAQLNEVSRNADASAAQVEELRQVSFCASFGVLYTSEPSMFVFGLVSIRCCTVFPVSVV